MLSGPYAADAMPGEPLSARVALNRISQCVILLAACALAQPLLAAEPSKTPVDSATAFLLKVQNAARELDYSGVFTYQQGGTMVSSRIVHMVDGTGERERLEILDGPPREYIRHNGTVQCLIPEKKMVVLQKRRSDRFPGLLIDGGKQLSAHYVLKEGASPGRIAGRSCTMVELLPKDDLRYGYRLCTDTRTHLLLKAQTLGAQQHVVDQISFTSLRIGEDVSADALAPAWNIKGWQVLKPSTAPIDLSSMGWRISLPPGFHDVTQVSRTMAKNKRVSQLVLSDGLAAISVFIEPFNPDNEHTLSGGAVQEGALNVFRARIGDHWLTALGEVPAQTLRELAERTEYVPLAAPR